jgi:hypothetical protein
MKRLSVVRVLAAVAVAAGVAGCGAHPYLPASTASYSRPAVAKKLSPPLLGVEVYSEAPYSAAQSRAYATPVLAYLKNSLHAQVAGLMWDLCSPSFNSNVVAACKSNAKTGTGSMSASAIDAVAGIAKADGLQVAMRPIIRIGSPANWDNPNKSWEGHLSPASEPAFFASLLKAELPYLKVAKKVHVEQFIVTTELESLRYSPSWASFLTKAQKDCDCTVSYSSYEAQYLDNSPSLPPTKIIGVDLYPSLKLPNSASQAQVTAAWEESVSNVAESRLDRTSMDEVSIRGTAGAYKHPYAWNDGGKAEPNVQARYFTGACATAARYHMRAVFFYFVPLNDNPASPIQYPAYFVKNAGSKAIAGCRSILARG